MRTNLYSLLLGTVPARGHTQYSILPYAEMKVPTMMLSFEQCCGSETKVSDPVSDPDPA